MLASLVLASLVLAAGTLRRNGRLGALLLGALSLTWLLVNDPMEGVILLTVTPTHGLTGADLAGLAGLGLAAWHVRGGRRGKSPQLLQR